MFRSIRFFAALALLLGGATAFAGYEGIGRPATPAEIKAWDIDVRPDFTGLPKGSGTVAKGEVVWDKQCTSCQGAFGESNEVFVPIVGGTTKEDILTGRVKALTRPDAGRTTLMKLSSISTLWDYINRAMPWTAPKTLTVEEVYAVTAYILHLGGIVPEDFTLSDQNIAAVQGRLPNRHGMTQAHGLADVKGRPDMKNDACMKNCPTDVKVMSAIPDYARNAHGNLMAQDRIVGPVRGADTTTPAPVARAGELGDRLRSAALATIAKASPAVSGTRTLDGAALSKQHACVACHAMEQKTVGPSIKDIAGKYGGQGGAASQLIAKVKAGGAGAWGDVPMPPQAHVSEDDLKILIQWMLTGTK